MSGLQVGSRGGMKSEDMLAYIIREPALNPFDVLSLLQLNPTIPVPAYEALVVTLLFLSDAQAFILLLSKLDSRLSQCIYGKTFSHLWSQR
jgi:hypothetical protein